MPDGTLALVNDVAENADGSTTLAVQRAAVPDAFVDLEIDFKGPLALEDRGLPTGTEGGLRRGDLRLQSETTRDFGFGPATGAGFTCSGSATTTMSFDASFQSSSAEVTFDLSERHLRFLATTTPTITAEASLDGSATCTREIGLPGKLPLGPTGLFLSADLALDITATGHISASASVGTPVSMGFDYRAGTVTNLSSASYTGSAGIAEEETQVSVTVTPSVELDLEFLGAVEIGLVLTTPLTGTVIPAGEPCATLDVAGSLGAEAELELPWLPDMEAEIGQFDLGSRQVWSGECEDLTVDGQWSGRLHIDYSFHYGEMARDGSASVDLIMHKRDLSSGGRDVTNVSATGAMRHTSALFECTSTIQGSFSDYWHLLISNDPNSYWHVTENWSVRLYGDASGVTQTSSCDSEGYSTTYYEVVDMSGDHNGSTGITQCERAIAKGFEEEFGAGAAETSTGDSTYVRDDRPTYDIQESCRVTWQLTRLKDDNEDGIPDHS